MRQLELVSLKQVRRRSPTPPTPRAPLVLKEEELREVLRLMAQAIVAVARSGKEAGDER
jgi:hypothetical protein